MYKNSVHIRLENEQIIKYLKNVAQEKNISINKAVNECIKMCSENEHLDAQITALNEKMDQIIEKQNSIEKQTNILFDTTRNLVECSCKNYVVSLILLQGKFNEYRTKNVDASRYYNTNFEEALKKSDVTNEQIQMVLNAIRRK